MMVPGRLTPHRVQPVVMKDRKQARERGRRAEQIAAKYLSKQGYRIIERNFACKLGEIDIIARHEGDLVFVEVRSRHSASAVNPAYSVDRDPELHGVFSRWLAIWQPKAKAAVDALAPLFASAPNSLSAATVSDMVARRYANFVEECGLPVHTQTPA